MTYPDHFLLSYGGTLMDGAEIWSNNIRFWDKTGADASPLIDEQSALEHARTNITTLFNDPRACVSTSTHCTWIKFNRIGPLGLYESATESNTLFLDGAAAIRGEAGNTSLPPQSAVAISFLTDRTRGPASRGRLFAPQPHLTLHNAGGLNGTIQDPARAGLAAVYAEFIAGLGNWPGLDLTEFVPSVVSNVGEGSAAAITSVAVGSIVDTQRRRRNAIPEVYTTVAV